MGVGGDIRNGFKGQGPWWVEVIRVLGPTTVIALGLVWWLTQSLAPVLIRMSAFMDQHERDTLIAKQESERMETNRTIGQMGLIGRLQQMNDLITEQHKMVIDFEFQICINQAKSPYQIAKCNDILERMNSEALKHN